MKSCRTRPLDAGRSISLSGCLPIWLVICLSLGSKLIFPNAYAAASARVELTERMTSPRQGHTATVLDDGRVLIVGGRDELGILASAEVYDPATRRFSAAGAMTEARSGHAATLLPDGRVLITGGQNGHGLLASAEVFETNQKVPYFRRVVSMMRTERFGHTSSLLRNGQVLVAGGDEEGTAELFDPKGELFLGELMVMGAVRSGHAATLLGQGSLFLTGGGDRSAEYYRIGESRFNLWPNGLMEERRGHSALVSAEGRLVLVGGDASGTVEELNAANGLFWTRLTLGKTVTGATLLANRKVLVLGPDVAGLYATDEGSFAGMDGLESLERRGQTATELREDKRILVVGGVNRKDELVGEGAVFNPAVLTTELTEYPSGSLVGVEAKGYLGEEEVELEAKREDGKGYEGKSRWLARVDGEGNFSTSWQVCEGDCAGAVMRLSAVGLTSGLRAQTTIKVIEPSTGEGISDSKTGRGERKSVTITAPSISVAADKAANATSPSYTALGNIVITEAVATDFATGSGKTIRFSAPTGWRFNTSGVTASFSPSKDITAASISSISSSAITVTITVGGTSKMDTLTLVGIQVQATDGANLPGTATITRTAGTATVSGLVNGTVVGTLAQTVGTMSKLVVTLAGQTFTDGSTLAGSGNSGTVTAQAAGVSFNLTNLTATDQFFNIITSYSGTKTIGYTGPGGLPVFTTAVDFASGQSTTTLATTLTKAESTTITANDGTITGPASSSLTVSAGAISKLQLLMPGETSAPGTAAGKTGAPTAQTAGTAFNVIVNSVDANWNLVSSTRTISLTSSDPNATMPANFALSAGTRTRSVTFKTAGSATVTATDTTVSGPLTSDTSPSTTVNAGTVVKLQILVPGEAASPGSATGKTATPSAQTAGAAISAGLVINAVDANWNVVSGSTPTVTISSTDVNAAITDDNGGTAGHVTLVAGTATLSSFTFKTSGTRTITATHTSGTLTANTSPNITVNAGPLAQLQILMPGETASPGSASGKTGTPTAQTAAVAIANGIVVRAVDANWNLVTTGTPAVSLGSTDAYATIADDNGASAGHLTLVAGTRTLSSFTFKAAGTRTITATDTSGALAANTSANITVNAGTAVKLLILVPGEVADPGSATGKTAVAPDAQTAGTAIGNGIVVRAVDANWNLAASTATVTISSTDTNAAIANDNGAAAGHLTLVGGTKTLSSFTFHTAGTRTITATHTSGTLTANTSGNITVNAGAFTKLQLLVPGETAAPGVTPGKTGTPNSQTTGNAFSVTVNAVDADWNRVSTVTDLVGITSSDGSATLPANANLAAGTMTFSVTLNVIAGTATITASDIFDGLKSPDTSPTITVNSSPNITSQPSSQTVCSGSSASFSVTATGTSLTYQWRKNTTNIPGATGATYTIASTTTGDAGSYDVVVTGNISPAATSTPATLTVTTAVAITSSPVSQTVCSGTSASFTVSASGGALSYQWRKDTVAISGATNSTYTIGSVSAADVGSYDVVVNNACALPATSNAATLAVTAPPSTTSPSSETRCPGDSVSFSVTAMGTDLTYQWRKDGSNISGATAATLAINPVGAGDAGSYDVVVTGTCNLSVTSSAATLTVNAVPSITTPPTVQTVCTGGSAIFSVVATGNGLTYQWRKDTVNIPGATASTLTIDPVGSGDAGSYDVAVSGTCSPAVTSSAATLTVTFPVTIVTPPVAQTVCLNDAASFSVVASGTGPFTYQWRKGAANISGATGSSYTIASTSAGSAGVYDVVVTGACSPSGVISDGATLIVNLPPSITASPSAQTVCAGATVNFSVTATGALPLTYQWRKNGVNISGATAATLTLNSVGTAEDGSYDVVVSGACSPAATSNTALLTVNTPPNIISQSGSQTVCAGQPVGFSVTATGAGLTYQWRKDGFAIPGATASAYNIASAGTGDAAAYDVVILGTCSPTATSIAALLTVDTLPAITSQPVAQSVCPGASASFSVSASGSGLAYQWRRNGVDLTDTTGVSGATTATLLLSAVDANQTGSYDVVVSGTCSPAVTSTAVTLSLKSAPVISTHPATQTICSGSAVTLSVIATGSGLTYQWRKGGINLANGGNISGATTASLSINPAIAADTGSYDVIVTGDCAPAVTSNAAVLTVPDTPGAAGSISGLTTVCAQTTGVTYSLDPVPGATTYLWAVPVGATIVSGQGTTSIVVNWGSTTGDVSVRPSNACFSNTTTTLQVTVVTPPTITSQPISQTVCAAADVTFTVSLAATSGPLTYQWRKNGANLTDGGNVSGANTATLSVAAVGLSEVGNYDVVVSGNCSPAVTSTAAILSLNAVASFVQNPVDRTVCVGSSTTFSALASGGGLTYQWRKGGIDLQNSATFAGVNLPTLTVLPASAADAGAYDVVVSGPCGVSVTSSVANLTVNTPPAITAHPASTTKCTGETAAFSVTATGTGLTYVWRKNGSIVPTATSSNFTIAAVGLNDAGTYAVIVSGTCGSVVTSSAATLTVNTLPAITTQPVNRTVCAGSSASFSVVAMGSGLAYQWRKDGANLSNSGSISGANAATLNLAAVSDADAGSYDVVVTGACTTITSAARTLALNAAPTLTSQPAHQTACSAALVNFSVSATGSGLTYQWRRNGANLANGRGVSGATTRTLTLVAGTAGSAAIDCVVRGSCGSAVTSTAATFTVNARPVVTGQPLGQTVCQGSSVSFSVTATGGGITYQWRKNNVDLPNGGSVSGATTSVLTIDPVSATDAGTYTVRVSGACTPAAISAAAALKVTKALGTAGAINGPTLACAGKAGLVFSIAPVAEATGYTWTVPTGARIVSGQGKTSISVTWGTEPGDVTVTPRNTCFTGSAVTRAVTVSSFEITQQPTDQTLLADCSTSVSFTAAAAGTPAPTVLWQVSSTGGRTWSNLAGKTNATLTLSGVTPAQNGYKYRALFKNACSVAYSSAATLTAVKVATTSELSVTPDNPQYSDKVTLVATLTPASSCGLVPATNVAFYIGTRSLGVVNLTPNGESLQATLNAAITEAPGARAVRAVFGKLSPYFTVSPVTNSLTVLAEDATAAYIGATNVVTDATGKATITLKAMVKDITAVSGDPAFDSNAGQIRFAKVAFIDRDTGAVIKEVAVTPSTDSKVGTATFAWIVNIGTNPSAVFNVGMVVKNYYTRDDPGDDREVNVRHR